MSIKIIKPINIGRGGRPKGYRSLSEIRLDLVELRALMDGLGRQVDEMRTALADVNIKVDKDKGKGKSMRKGAEKQRIDMKRLAQATSVNQDIDSALEQLRSIKAGLQASGMSRSQLYRSLSKETEELEAKFRRNRDRAVRYLDQVAKGHVPPRFREFAEDFAEKLHESMDGQYDKSVERTVVDANPDGKLRFTYYILFDGVEFDGGDGFRHRELVVPVTHDTGRKGHFVSLLSRFKHPGRFNYGAHVANVKDAMSAVSIKLRAMGLMDVLLDENRRPFAPGTGKGSSFPHVTHLVLEDDDFTLTFTVEKGVKPQSVLKELQAGVASLIKATHPRHLVTHEFRSRNRISFRISKDAPYLADRKAQERMADELNMSPEARKSFRDWFVEHMTNDLPDDDDVETITQDEPEAPKPKDNSDPKPSGKPRKAPKPRRKPKAEPRKAPEPAAEPEAPKPKAAPGVTFGRVDASSGADAVEIRLDGDPIGSMVKDDDMGGWYVDDAPDDGSPLRPSEFLGDDIRSAKKAVEDMVRSETSGIDTISGDVPMDKPEALQVRAPYQRSVNRTLVRLAEHFRGDSLPPGDPLYGVAKAIPGVDLGSRLALLTKPHSVFVSHVVLLTKGGEKALVDHNAFLKGSWEPSSSPVHRDPSRTGEYRAVFVDGSRALYKPRRIMSVSDFIKDSGARFAVRSLQLRKKRMAPSPKGSQAKTRRKGADEETSARAPQRKGGILPWMIDGDEGVKVLIVRPTGSKGRGSWSLAKGGARKGESSLEAAKREFSEETGIGVPRGVKLEPLGEKASYPGLSVWAVPAAKLPGSADAAAMTSNSFRRRGRRVPEIAEHRWTTIKKARRLLDKRMRPYLKDIESMGLV